MDRKFSFFLALLCSIVSTGYSQEFLVRRAADQVSGGSQGFLTYMPGDTIWLEAGLRSHLLISDFHGTAGKPVVFANRNGQVIIDTEYSYGLSIRSCSHFVVIGLPGEGYDYGIKISRVGHASGTGISVGNKSTDFTLAGCEVSHTGFAGIIAKTEPVCGDPGTYRNAFTQYNTVIRNCYVHDVTGEGMYVGSSFFLGQTLSPCGNLVLPPTLEGVHIHNNRVERTGLDGLQVSSAVKDCYIHHNILNECSYLMTESQMSGIIIGGGSLAKCFNNQIFDPYGTGILLFGDGGTEVFNNLIVRPGRRYLPENPEKREHGIFISDKTRVDNTWYGIYQNTIIQPKSDGIRIDNTVSFECRIYNNIVIDPGAYDVYENDNTDRIGTDAYIFDVSRGHNFKSESNYFSRLFTAAGFSNSNADNYRLHPGSPMIDLGKSLYSIGIRSDLDDHDRPAGMGYDIGAYEYRPGMGAEQLPSGAGSGLESWQILPEDILRLVLKSSEGQKLRICISDLAGRVVYQDHLAIQAGRSPIIDVPLAAKGLLIITVHGDITRYAGKIMVY
jgi:hypothetical protein